MISNNLWSSYACNGTQYKMNLHDFIVNVSSNSTSSHGNNDIITM